MFRLLLPTGLLAASLAFPVPADETSDSALAATAAEPGPKPYLRVVEEDPVMRLETAVVRMADAAGRHVDVYGAIHIADLTYYHALNEVFSAYDAVLFELVVDESVELADQLEAMAEGQRNEGQPEAPEAAAFRMLSLGQELIGSLLHLTFQTQEVDYLAANFVHADMTLQQFTEAQETAGENLLGALYEAEGQNSLAAMRYGSAEMFAATAGLLRGNPVPAKRWMARTLATTNLGGGAIESVLLTGRNEVAMTVLDKQLEAGPDDLELAVFYGVAHLPDLIERLGERGFEVEETDWLSAWTIDPAAHATPEPIDGDLDADEEAEAGEATPTPDETALALPEAA